MSVGETSQGAIGVVIGGVVAGAERPPSSNVLSAGINLYFGEAKTSASLDFSIVGDALIEEGLNCSHTHVAI